ncbi:MAG TPA: YbaN family protein [Patescibacteria group bacterium]|nr:YbaN family protein [Patescibacteria group bacterium]
MIRPDLKASGIKGKGKKRLLALCGMVAVGLGAAGIFLPLLPTTPFLLLAAACFLKSSDRLYNWLITHRWFGRYIRQYREYRAISKQTKVATIILLWGTLAFSGLVVLEVLWGRILLLAVGIGVTVHLLSMKTLK